MSTLPTNVDYVESRLDKTVLRSLLDPKQKNFINDDTIEELTKLANNPDYGSEFLDMYKDHLSLVKGKGNKFSPHNYMNAIKFYSMMESGNTIVDSYIKVFPERFKRRADRGQTKNDITGEAARFNATALVNDIRKVAGIPVQLIHRNILHEAILASADLMRNASSDTVKQKAAETLIRELKPSEDQTINLKVEDGATSAIEELRLATAKLVAAQEERHNAGVPLKSIIEGKIIGVEIEEA